MGNSAAAPAAKVCWPRLASTRVARRRPEGTAVPFALPWTDTIESALAGSGRIAGSTRKPLNFEVTVLPTTAYAHWPRRSLANQVTLVRFQHNSLFRPVSTVPSHTLPPREAFAVMRAKVARHWRALLGLAIGLALLAPGAGASQQRMRARLRAVQSADATPDPAAVSASASPPACPALV